MAAPGDRRIGVGRRSMTVLGKIPSPAVPKPINLPSQKLENKGLEANVEIVPRGTFSWGSTSRTATSANKSGTLSVVSSPPSSAGAWGGAAAKLHAFSGSGNEAGILVESAEPSSPGSGPRPSSAPTSTRAWGTIPKSQLHEDSSGSNSNPADSWPHAPQGPEGPQRTRDALPQKNIAEHSNRPMSADGSLLDKDRHPLPLHPGASSHGRGGPGPGPSPGPGPGPVPIPGSFPHPGDGYSDYIMRQGVHPPVVHDVPGGLGVYPRPSPHEVFYRFGVPHYNNMKDRDIAMVAMINNAGYYGSYPPQVAHPEYMAQRPIYGNYGPRPPHPEQFIRPHGNMGLRPHDLNMSMGHARESEFLSHEGEGFYDPRNDIRKYGDGYPASGLAYGTDQSHRPQNMSGRSKFGHREGRDSGNDLRDHQNPVSEKASSAVPLPEGKITLLTKSPRLDEQGEGDINHNLGKKGSETISNIEQPKGTADNKDEDANGNLAVKDVKAGDHVEMKRSDGLLTNKGSKETEDSEQVEIKRNGLLTNKGTKDERIFQRKNEHVLHRKDEHMRPKKDERITSKKVEQIILPSLSVGIKKDELLVGSIVSEMASVSSMKVDSKSNDLAVIEETKSVTETQILANNSILPECGVNVPKNNKKSDKVSIPTISVGEDHRAASKESSKSTTVETSLKDESKAKGGRQYNQKAGKGWRPKSPVKGMNSSHGLHGVKVIEQDSCTGNVVDVQYVHSSDRKDGNSFVGPDRPSLSSIDVGPGYHNGKGHHKDSLPVCTSGDLVKDNHEEKSKVVSTDNLPSKDDFRAKSRQGNQKVDKEWRPKSPAVEPHVPVKVSVIQYSKQEVADNESTEIQNQRTPEQEASDAYDYERQRAKLKEIAAQRAMQLRQEEEERAKEQRAKALAKLEELDRRTAALPTIVETSSGHDNVLVNDDGVSKKLKQKQTSVKHTINDSPSNDSSASVVPTSLSSNVKGDEKREHTLNAMIPPLSSRDKVEESLRSMKSTQFLASTHKDHRQFPRRVDSDRLHDAPSNKKPEVDNNKNEGTSSTTRLPQRERNYETISADTVKEDKHQRDFPDQRQHPRRLDPKRLHDVPSNKKPEVDNKKNEGMNFTTEETISTGTVKEDKRQHYFPDQRQHPRRLDSEHPHVVSNMKAEVENKKNEGINSIIRPLQGERNYEAISTDKRQHDFQDQRQHPRRVDLDRLHDSPSDKKLEVDNKRNEVISSRNHLPQRARSSAKTEETISTGIVKEDKRQHEFPDQRKHPRKVESNRSNDMPSNKKQEVENMRNEGTNTTNHLSQRERNYATTEETISAGTVKEDKQQHDSPVSSLGDEVHNKGQPSKAASMQQRAKEGAHYRPRQMIAPDTNVSEEHLVNLEKNTSTQLMHLSLGLDSRHSSEKHGRLHGSWRQKHSSTESSGAGSDSKHIESASEGNFDMSMVKHRSRHVESVPVGGKFDNSVPKAELKHIDGICVGNINHSELNPLSKQTENVLESDFDNVAVKPQFKHIESSSEGNPDNYLGKSHGGKNGRKHSSRAAGEMHKQGGIQPETAANFGLESKSENVLVSMVSGPNMEEEKGGGGMKSGRSRNSWRQKNVNGGHPSLKPSSLKEHPAEVKESQEDQLNLASQSLVPPSSELSHSSSIRNDGKYIPRLSSGQPVRANNQRSPRVSNAPGQGKPPLPAAEDGPNIIGQGRYSGSNKHVQEIDNLPTTNQRKGDGLLMQTEEAATAYPEGNVQGYKRGRNRAKAEGYKSNRQYQPTSQGFKQTLEEHSETKVEGTSYGVHRHGRARERSLRKTPLNGCSTSLELEKKDSETTVKSEISY